MAAGMILYLLNSRETDTEGHLDVVEFVAAFHLINPSLDVPPLKAQETALRMSFQDAIDKLSPSTWRVTTSRDNIDQV